MKVQQEIALLSVKDEYVLNSSEFERVKARLIQIDNNILTPGAAGSEGGGSKRPTLKRRTNTGSKDKEKPTLEKDRPTLKRGGESLL